MNNRSRKLLVRWLVIAVVAVLFLIGRFADIIVDWLWFNELGYGVIFSRILFLKLGLGGAVGLVALLFLGFNFNLAFQRSLSGGLSPDSDENVIEVFPGERWRLPPPLLRWGAWLLAFILAIPFSVYASSHWDSALRFFWNVPVDQNDPVYGRDLGFYLFELPFLQALQNSITALFFLAFGAVLLLALTTGLVRGGEKGFSRPRPATQRHLVLTFLLFLVGYAWGYGLERYELLYSASGIVYGAGYTDLQVTRIGLWIMIGASAILAGLVVFAYKTDKPRWALWSTGGYFGLAVLLLLLGPMIVQKFLVEPNELELESPYLQHEIALTRQAYAIDRLDESSYAARTGLTREKLETNKDTLRNIRLWDWRPLLKAFRQLQEIRLYYQFYEVDIDRYRLDGEYRQTMLSARELAPELPSRADTWLNRTLQFTHGYGLAMSLASQEGVEGTPTFLVQDLPPRTDRGLDVNQAAIYYGETMPGYRIVNTGVKELDYPKGDENVYTSYTGKGGIPVGNFWKKLLFAWELNDINILLSDYLNATSRIQIHRRVRERVGRLAPFLRLDADPYLVLSEGKLFWIQDAYTTSDRFPYSEPFRNDFNYIRNSVKIVVDAYHGTVSFYVMQPDEPVLNVYQKAFPNVFRPLADMPPEIRKHLRYPEDLFRIQVDKYNRYHMTIPQVFYNNEDLWTLPQEKYAGNPTEMDPYYILMRLPGEERLEFLLMLPLTPKNRDNMIGWIAARCDEPGYGRMLVFKLPKEKLVLGPMQIEAMIDQDPVISRQLSLWDQRGSQVIRGNLLVIPVEQSFIYVEPVYLIAEGNNIPQLRRVIVAYDDRVAMEPTLQQAISAIFGKPAGTGMPPTAAGAAQRQTTTAGLEDARASFRRAQDALQKSDWKEFGEAMQELKTILEDHRQTPAEPAGPGSDATD